VDLAELVDDMLKSDIELIEMTRQLPTPPYHDEGPQTRPVLP